MLVVKPFWLYNLRIMGVMSSVPDYLICMECETPCYTFEWKEGKLTEITCLACGADAVEDFMTEEDHEALIYGWVITE